MASALALFAVMSLFAVPAEALSRSDGDFWAYEGSMNVEGVSVDGTFKYEFEKADSLTIGSDIHEVNVMRVSGSMTGETEDLFGMSASVSAVFSGRVYETKDGFGTLKDDMYTWINMTIGTGSFTLVTRMETQEVSTYSPPSFSGFDEDETGTGDEWNETTNVTRTSTLWIDGVIDDTSTAQVQETSRYSVAASEDKVSTDAGTFDCLKITVTDSEGNYDVNWYSAEVGNYVKMSYFELGETTPYLSLELAEYKHSEDSALMLVMFVGIGVIAAIVIIVVILLLMRKRGQAPVQAPPQVPPPVQ